MIEIRRKYKDAVAIRNYKEAIRIRSENPDIFGAPLENVLENIAAIADDPLEPKWMVVEWSVQKNACKDEKPGCSEYIFRSLQFDHLPAGVTEEEINEWFQKYVDNRIQAKGGRLQLGTTLYLVEVKEIKQITDFEGEVI